MNNGGDAAEQVVRLSLEGFEVAARLSGSAAKNIALLLVSVLKQEQKTKGKDLVVQALEIQPFSQSDVWDGELDGRMVKIMPVNRIATKADLEELTAMDMTMKCPHSSIKNLPLCLTTRLKEQRKKGLNWKEKNCVSVKSGKQG